MSLEARVARLEAIQAVTDVLHAYAHAIDYGDHAAWLDCFTADGVMELRSAGGTVRVEGHGELASFAGRHSHAPDAWHKHLALNPLVEVDGDHATCRSSAGLLVEHDGVVVVQVLGRYDDRLRRCPDGRWRLATRRAEIESSRADVPSRLAPPR